MRFYGILVFKIILWPGLMGQMAFVHAEEHHDHMPHVHGAATLSIALEGNQLQMELDSPAINLVGFEHQPYNNQQRQSVEDAIRLLKDVKKLLTFPDQAGCLPIEVHVETPLTEHGHGAAYDHDEGKHADFHGYYKMQCRSLQFIEMQPLFRAFKGVEKVTCQIVTAKKQIVKEVTAKFSKVSVVE